MPFVTELTCEIGDSIREVGHEYGATTGRKRRCGWLDMVLVRQSVRLSGITGIALTKLDVLAGLDTLKICTGYETPQGNFTESVPANPHILAQCRPVYEEMAGWKEDITKARNIEELPQTTRRYIERLETLAGVKMVLLSVGAGREETIILKNPFEG